MLSRLRVQNFMSLKDTTVDLSPVTIFIGPNGSGKSAIFKSLVTLSKLLHQFPVRGPQGEFNLEPGVSFDHLVWRGNSGLPIVFQVWFVEDGDGEPSYTLELFKETRGWSVRRERLRLHDRWFDSASHDLEFSTERRGVITFKTPHRATLSHLVYPYRNDESARPVIAPFLQFAGQFGFAWRYRPSASDIASFFAPSLDSDPAVRVPFVGENGAGLSLVLQRLQGQDRLLFERIEHDLAATFPHIRFINFQSERFGVRVAFTTNRSEDIVPAPQESDGVLLTTFLLWRLYTADPNLKVCLEEPENGTHPYLLKGRYELIKRLASGEAARPRLQVLVATHSPDFLTVIDDPDEARATVRLVEFDPANGTQVHSLQDVSRLDSLMAVFKNNLGDLWWSGAIGAVPSTVE